MIWAWKTLVALSTGSYSEKPLAWLRGMTRMQPFSFVEGSIATEGSPSPVLSG